MNKILPITLIAFLSFFTQIQAQQHSVAREWNELLLQSIREDLARPTVHARNLFHTSAVMYDAWAVFDEVAETYLLGKTVDGFTCNLENFTMPDDIEAAREEAMSFAAYRLLIHRFGLSRNFAQSILRYNTLMNDLGYDRRFTSQDYATNFSAAALGNYIAQCYINYGLQDGSNDLDNRFGNWFLANQQMLAAFNYANQTADRRSLSGPRYQVKHIWTDGKHSDQHGGALLPDMLRWLWSNEAE